MAKYRKLGRTSSQRKALLRNQVTNLLYHGRIVTTEAKAKEIRKIAESLIGCENVENALLLIKQAWTAREKALKMEYGKIPGPGAGGSNEDKEMQAAIELAKDLGKRKAQSDTSVRDQLKGLVR